MTALEFDMKECSVDLSEAKSFTNSESTRREAASVLASLWVEDPIPDYVCFYFCAYPYFVYLEDGIKWVFSINVAGLSQSFGRWLMWGHLLWKI